MLWRRKTRQRSNVDVASSRCDGAIRTSSAIDTALNTRKSMQPPGQTLQQAFEALIAVLKEQNIRYAVIGGLALIQHTRVRTTDDIDALLIVPEVAIPRFLSDLSDRGFAVDFQRNTDELRRGLTTIRFADV